MKYKSIYVIYFLVVTAVLCPACVLAKTNAEPYINMRCSENSLLYQIRSKELKELAKEDQRVRTKFTKMSPENMIAMSKDDLKRRIRVSQIFAEGCLRKPNDYEIAALIFQHGDVPDHFYQAYIWANRAGDLGVKSAYQLAALALDRYLVSTGRKQIFGSQYFIADMTSLNKCFCMQPVELSFPDSKRKDYGGKTLQESYIMLKRFNEMNGCKNEPAICKTHLNSTIKGTVPGVW